MEFALINLLGIDLTNIKLKREVRECDYFFSFFRFSKRMGPYLIENVHNLFWIQITVQNGFRASGI